MVMSTSNGQRPDLDAIKKQVREVFETGMNVQGAIRDLMLEAIKPHPVDIERVRQVTRTVVDGIGEAVSGDKAAADAVRQSLHGVEDALSQAGQAMVLGMREAAGSAGEFARQDLKAAMDELASLQKVYVESLAEVLGDIAHTGADTIVAIFSDFQRHAKNSGSSFHDRIAGSIDLLRQLLPSAPIAGERLPDFFATLDRVAAGVMRGVREGLNGAGSERAGDDKDAPR